ncbi:MAG TPA: methyltransferase [Pedococcus sp.]|nr:methyltransferase [Pedococcus sp.]
MSAPTTPPRADHDLVARLRADLSGAGYTVDGVAELLGPLASAALAREQTLPAQRVTAASTEPAATLVRLFTLGDAVDEAEAGAALSSLGVTGALALGIVVQQGPGVVATCDLRPYGDEEHEWWVASDLSELATRQPLREDHVLGIGGASTTLASWTPRPEVDRALDLGTGCGVQALHLGSHVRHITATDISERALAYARFNALLNGVQWELRAGSLLDPVAAERFGLIVSNPPFVITPRGAGVPLFEYRDGGAAGDTIVADLVRSIGDHLEPGGIAQFLGNWEIVGDADWRERVRGWVSGTGLDAWVVQRDVQDPAQYAETWARDGGHHSATAEFAAMYAAWLDDFASRGVTAIGFGVITLQRPATRREPFIDLEEAEGRVAAPMGPAVLAGVRARTWLVEHSDDDLLAVAWRCAPDVTEERHGLPGAEDPSIILLRQGGGLGRAVRLTTAMAALASVCDGDLTARQALAAIASLLDVSDDELRASAVPVIRELVADGLLVRDE